MGRTDNLRCKHPIIQNTSPQLTKTPETVPEIPTPLSNILKKSEPTTTVPVILTSTPQTAPAAVVTDNNEDTTECLPPLPQDLEVIKEIIQHEKDDDYIPFLSAITLKKMKRMLFLHIEFNNVKIDALVDSGAYINAISERDAKQIKHNSSNCIIKKAPPPLLKSSTVMQS